MPEQEANASELIERIIASPFVRAAKRRQVLLRFLFGKTRPVSRATIAKEAFNDELDDNAVGQQCSALRNALRAYANAHASEEKLRCYMPTALPGEGLRLVFIDEPRQLRFTASFWNAHFESKPTVLSVVGEEEEHDYFKYDELMSGDLGLHRPTRAIAEFLARLTAIEIEEHSPLSMAATQVIKSSAVLVGRPHGHPYIQTFLSSSSCRHFCYNIPNHEYSLINVRNITAGEREKCSNFVVTDDLDGLSRVSTTGTSWHDTSFCVVYRLTSPAPGHALTIITSSSFDALFENTLVFTSDKLLDPFCSTLGWGSPQDLPACFELLLANPHNSSGSKGSVGYPEILGFRVYEGSLARGYRPRASIPQKDSNSA